MMERLILGLAASVVLATIALTTVAGQKRRNQLDQTVQAFPGPELVGYSLAAGWWRPDSALPAVSRDCRLDVKRGELAKSPLRGTPGFAQRRVFREKSHVSSSLGRTATARISPVDTAALTIA